MNNRTLDYAKNLKNQYHFHAALKILEEVPEEERNEAYYLLKAQCYYQDFQLPKTYRFDTALSTLEKIAYDSDEKNRLIGAIYKRKYEFFKDKDDLDTAITYYEKAANNISQDHGYGLGNLLYLYCMKWKDEGVDEEKLRELEVKVELSISMLETLQQKDPWDLASLTNLYLFNGDKQKAKEAIERYKSCFKGGIDRDQQITLVQLVKLFDILPKQIKTKFDKKDIEYLLEVYPHYKNIIESARKIHTKFGLALSGGGFRASLYHIGTLMRLAELGLLSKVEVISTVSGGSIVGMMYYLMLKQKFEKGEGDSIDYIALVDELKRKFLTGIQENIRMKAFDKSLSEPLTQKIGELYQELLYDRIGEKVPTKMREIDIVPKGFDDFNPHFHNFTLKNKVPRIIVNATLLNNGHNWQFTSKGMGENSYMYDITVDKNPSYPFRNYSEICGDITVGTAIAASSAVPGLFDPVEIDMFDDKENCTSYQSKGKLKICDGGVYDNLGLASLINDECTHVIISDGSKQMKNDANPSVLRLDVLSRTQDMLMTKNRDAEYRLAKHFKTQGIVNGLVISHMKEEIGDEKKRCLFDKVASIRTDLDAFNDTEAHAIIYSGYIITSMQFEDAEVCHDFGVTDKSVKANRCIEEFESYYSNNAEKVLKIVENGSNVFFKAVHYVPKVHLGLLLIVVIAVLAFSLFCIPQITLLALLLTAGLFVLNKKYFKWFFNKVFEGIMKYMSRYYIKCINPKYLEIGSINDKSA